MRSAISGWAVPLMITSSLYMRQHPPGRVQQRGDDFRCGTTVDNDVQGARWNAGSSEKLAGWGGRIRTCECKDQNLVSYHLTTPQSRSGNQKLSSITEPLSS